MQLDLSQLAFCQSTASCIRLLAPAGSGKTLALLYRCREVARRSSGSPRFLVVTFTRSATAELNDRLASDPDLSEIRDQVHVSTLNAYGFRRMRDQLSHTRLLSSNTDKFFALQNQLRPVWLKYRDVAQAASRRGTAPRRLMDLIDRLKVLGFDHTADTNFEKFRERLEKIQRSDLEPLMNLVFEILTELKILDSKAKDGVELAADSPRLFYDRFFRFWREAVATLYEQNTFTFEDQKYWTWLDLRSPDAQGNHKRPVTGAARFDHILVDEFQDISALDLALIRTLVQRHQSSVVIVGDDDQAIFEWRGADPDYILQPEGYLDCEFEGHVLTVNYRSPANIVDHSQKLIGHNSRRVPKSVSSRSGVKPADISVFATDSLHERLQLVTELAQAAPAGSHIAVMGRLRSQLIPYEVFYAAGGGQVATAVDLDAFASSAFEQLMELLEIWSRRNERRGGRRAINDVVDVFSRIRRAPFSKRNDTSVRQFLQSRSVRSVHEAAVAFDDYDGPKLSGKTHEHLSRVASQFLGSEEVWQAVDCVADNFDGLRFDYEKADDDIWYTGPPLKQLAELARDEELDVDELIERLAAARDQVQHFQSWGEPAAAVEDQTLQLMTATRAKGKEFDTVIMLDTVEGVWPHKRAETDAQLEAERRLFYVAFTRARKRVIMLTSEGAPLSRFVHELDLPHEYLPPHS